VDRAGFESTTSAAALCRVILPIVLVLAIAELYAELEGKRENDKVEKKEKGR
jgi:hypothetical protein